jgi:hypothetical protein
MPGPNPYQYQFGANDDPVSVASVYGVTPQQLLAANPGGAPFTTGQMINIPTPASPYQYNAPTASSSPNFPPVGSMANPYANNNPYATSNPGYNVQQRGRGYSVPPAVGQYNGGVISTAQDQNSILRGRGIRSDYGPSLGGGYGTDDYGFYRGDGTDGRDTQTNLPGTTAPGTTPNTSDGDFYGYERDPETGRSVRVIKNAATGGDFLRELRWDPQRRRYVSIGSLLRSGRLDLKGNWRGKRRGGGGGQARKQQQEQNKQDFSLSNSLISFGGSSG